MVGRWVEISRVLRFREFFEAHGYGWVQVELRGLELQENYWEVGRFFFGLAIGGNATCVVHGRCSHFFAYLSLA